MGPMTAADANKMTGEAVGLIAGRGVFPFEFCRAARRAGVPRIVVVAMHGETSPEIEKVADCVEWAYVGQIRRAIRILKREGIVNVVFAGQIKPSRLFTGYRPDFTALRLMWRLRERNAESIFSTAADEFERRGLRVQSSATFMQDSLAASGVLGKVKPRRGLLRDIEFGLPIARAVSRLNIGQTIVVKRGTVLAVEGFEGTDQAIRRGAELGHGGVTVIKVAKPRHDVRFDIPCIGLRTVETMQSAGVKALAVQSGMTLLLERDKVLAGCDEAGIAVLGVDIAEPV
jgi:DUF1009 family protein